MFSNIRLRQDFQEFHNTKVNEFIITQLTSVSKKLRRCIHLAFSQQLLCVAIYFRIHLTGLRGNSANNLKSNYLPAVHRNAVKFYKSREQQLEVGTFCNITQDDCGRATCCTQTYLVRNSGPGVLPLEQLLTKSYKIPFQSYLSSAYGFIKMIEDLRVTKTLCTA